MDETAQPAAPSRPRSAGDGVLAQLTEPPARRVVLTTIAANVGVFALWRVGRKGMAPPWLANVLGRHFMCSYNHLKAGRVHTIFTSTISHHKTSHLILNAYGLFLFGNVAAEVLKPSELGFLMAMSGGTASMAHINVHRSNPVLGASGMLMGLVTACAFLDPKHEFHMMLPFPGLRFTMLQVADFCLVANLLGFFFLKTRFPIAWAAHLGGTAFGLGYVAGGNLRGDPRLANIWRVHLDNVPEDWRQTAISVDESIDRIRNFLQPSTKTSE
mmetsp:Transcript_6973/g.15897  ORF Transcript_6973/g.15897 Transcript_6973/m.15897 type:complete len:271 (-) Transcript_6973:19-831(-)